MGDEPWYRRARRWGQTNITEIDPQHYDPSFWREHWRRTRVQGIIVNAGGIVAYYPTRFELQYRAEHLEGRDLFGEITEAAREEGLAVLARMDSNRADEPLYRAHPDWFCLNAEGEPCRAGGRYQACVNGPYYSEYLPEVLREIIDRYHPDGFTDNSWTGMGRRYICHCENCARWFGEATGLDLPTEPEWEDEAYRRWIEWSYGRRLEVWDRNNRVTREHGGPDCLWLGMINGNPVGTHLSFCDLKAVGERSRIMMCDQQSRAGSGFEQNSLSGKLLHELGGHDIVIPESISMYVRGEQTFRRAANPAPESQTWMIEGFAGGISPWWHHVGARQEDRRQFRTAEKLMRWHEENEEYLYDRRPVANVGMLWSQRDIDFYGRERAADRVQLPWRGFHRAMVRARIPLLPVHADNVARDADHLDVLILPDLAVMTDDQCRAVRGFVESGGSVVATGCSSLLDEWGERREDFALGDVFGVRHTGQVHGIEGEPTSDWAVHGGHNYVRLPDERHPVLDGFEETDILPLGCTLQQVQARKPGGVIATYIPAFPIYPPEFSWMREPRTDVPAIVVTETDSGGRVVYLAADVDRRYGRQALPDHGDLLANAVRWATRGRLPISVQGPGYLDCHLYRQGTRLILHIVNLSGADVRPGYREEYLPVEGVSVRLRLPAECPGQSVRLLVSGLRVRHSADDGDLVFAVPRITDHEVALIE